MKYLASVEIAKKWNISERSVRNYCAKGRVVGAYLEGKTWMIPASAQKPIRKTRHSEKKMNLLETLKEEKDSGIRGGIYHKLQIEMTYNSNHIEGSTLTHDETRFIYETNTIGGENKTYKVDDVIETINHFRCVDLTIDFAKRKLSEPFIKQLHLMLKTGTEDSSKPWFAVGDYKTVPNFVGGRDTTLPEDVKNEMGRLIKEYNSKDNHSLEEIIEFHVRFERIHPFQDGNGRIGRLIAFKECLNNNIIPFIILNEKKMFYYRGLKNWDIEKNYLIETCLDGQDTIREYLNYFRIKY